MKTTKLPSGETVFLLDMTQSPPGSFDLVPATREQTLKAENVSYLRDLAERIYKIPVMYDVDDEDYSRLLEIAREIEK